MRTTRHPAITANTAMKLIITLVTTTAVMMSLQPAHADVPEIHFFNSEGGELPELDGETLKRHGPKHARCYFASERTGGLICMGVEEHVSGSEFQALMFDPGSETPFSSVLMGPTDDGRIEPNKRSLRMLNKLLSKAKDWSPVEPIWTADFNESKADEPVTLPNGNTLRLLEEKAVKAWKEGDPPPFDEKRTLQVETESGEVVATLDVASEFLAGDHRVTVWRIPGGKHVVVALTDYSPGFESRTSRFEVLELNLDGE